MDYIIEHYNGDSIRYTYTYYCDNDDTKTIYYGCSNYGLPMNRTMLEYEIKRDLKYLMCEAQWMEPDDKIFATETIYRFIGE